MIKVFYTACIAMAVIIYAIHFQIWLYFPVRNIRAATISDWREWIAATSGWVAAAAAFVTIRYLNRQIREQRKQTDFILGDSHPTADVLEHDFEVSTVVVQIVNWNRRPFLVNKIACLGDEEFIVDVQMTEIDDTNKPRGNIGSPEFRPAIRIPGWIDKAKSPHHAKITMKVFRADDNDRKYGIRRARFTIAGTVVGEDHQERVLAASAAFTTY